MSLIKQNAARAFSLVVVLVGVAGGLRADEAAPASEAPNPFIAGAADVGAWTHSDLADSPSVPLPEGMDTSEGIEAADYAAATRETHESVDEIAAHHDGENGAAVHSAWSAAVTAPGVAAAETAKAAYQAGLSGTEMLGVE